MTYDAIVVGGGIAGLTAAHSLTLMGRKVGLYEASNRLGGRILTTQIHAMNLGASSLSINQTHPNLLVPFLEKHKIRTKHLKSDDAICFDTQGKPIAFSNLHQSLNAEYEKAIQQIILARKSVFKTYPSIAEILNKDQESDPEKDSLADWARKLINASLISHIGAPLDKVSILELIEKDDFAHEREVLLLPTSQLIDALLTESNKTDNLAVHFNCALTQIKRIENNGASHFELLFTNGLIEETPAVILALPFSILKLGKIKFDPKLSPQKLMAFKHLGISYYNSVLLEFEHSFWDTKVHYLYPNETSENDWPRYLNMSIFTQDKTPILILQCAGKAAQFGHLTDDIIVKQALEPLKRVYGNKVSALKSYFVTRFDTDPHIMGGSLYYSMDTTKEDLDALLRDEMPGLYFAGDYLHPRKHGTLMNASESGLKASWQTEAYLKYTAQQNLRTTKSPKF